MAESKQSTATAADRYAELKPNRKDAETRAKRCAKVTLPRLWVDEGQKTRASVMAYSDTGPRCVNSLSAKVLLAWLPPNAGIFKLSPDEAEAQKLAEFAGVETSDLESAFGEVERTVINDIETSGTRTVLSEAAKHAIVIGNFCLYEPDVGPAKLYPLTSYVVDRDGLGSILEIVTLDKIAPALLPEAVRAAVMQKLSTKDEKTKATDVNLYTRIIRSEDGKMWEAMQEVEGFAIKATPVTYPIDASPWIVVAVPRSSVEDYGEGLVFDYIGAFESVEALRKALRKAAAAMAKILFILDPTSAMKEKHLASAESGEFIRGRRNDISLLQMDKAYDLNFVRNEADTLATKLETIFGVRSAIQRPGERVTATEWRILSQEIDDSLGGFYSLTGEDLLLPLIRRKLDKLQRQGRLPELPPGVIKPRITVGMAALGRGHDFNKLLEFGNGLKSIIGEQEFSRRINTGEMAARLGASADISTKGLIHTDEELDSQQQNSSMQEGLVKAAPQLAGALAGQLPPQQ